MFIRIFSILFLILFSNCRPTQSSQPRPHQYPRIDFPIKQYNLYSNEECPFTIQIPNYSKIVQKDFLFDDVPAGQCWFDIAIPSFEATIHCSYYKIENNEQFGELVNDAFNMASKHNIKASFREELIIENQFGTSGLLFKISGPVATPYQFFMTDSTNHFLRGSLYYDTQVNIDSVAPITEYLKKDIDVVLASLKWEE